MDSSPTLADRALRRPFSRRFVLFGGDLEMLATRPAGAGRLIVTPNLDHLRLLARSAAFRRAYAAADVVLNDSRALDRSFVAGRAFCLTGADLAPEMLKRLSPGAHVFFIGAPAVVEAAMRRDYPGLALSFHNPSMGYIRRRAERRALAAKVLEARPSCLFICTGAPQSEILAAQLKRAGCDADMLCCGSGLLFLAGATARAPVWMRRLGAEWAWRFLVEPRTRKRYAMDALFLSANLRGFLQLRRGGVGRFRGFELAAPA